ncbi:unnamed protein product, partial [Rotaria sp. Silwood1]
MEKENFCDNENDSEDEEKAMPALLDSDIDAMENQLVNINSNYDIFYNDDDTIYPPRAIDKMDKLMNNENKRYESDEYRLYVSRDEMKKFFAIAVQMGMIRKRSIREYWSTDPYLVTPIFHSPQYLSRGRFFYSS